MRNEKGEVKNSEKSRVKEFAMKKYICVLLPVLIALFGCTDPVQDVSKTDSGEIAPGMGRVIIDQVESQSRTLLPQTPVFVSYLLSFQYQGEGGANKDNQTVASLPCTVDLFPGPWQITVTAYTRIEGIQGMADGIYPAASGTAMVTAGSGAVVQVKVNLQNGTSMEGKGVLEYDIGLPEGTGTATLKVLRINKTELTSINLLETASGNIVLNAGYYILQVQIATGRTRTKTELIHIYGLHTTRAAGREWNFNVEEGGVCFSIAELSQFLNFASANTIDAPHAVTLIVNDLLGSSGTSGSVGAVLRANNGKYVNLDLSESTFANIDDYAFDGCTNLADVTIGNNVTGIGDNAFSGCTGLTGVTIPNDVISIGSYAFSDCTGLTSVTMPNNVTGIGNNPFSNCISLTSIDIDAANTAYSSIDGVLYNKDKTTLIAYPGGKAGDVIIPNGVTSIGDSAFQNCTGITDITIPDSVTDIYSVAFSGCTSLTGVTFQGTISQSKFSSNAFYGVSDLRDRYFFYGKGTYRRDNNNSAWNYIAKDGTYYSITELYDFLSSMPENTRDTPYVVALNVSNTGSIGRVSLNSRKYISLHLSSSTFVSIGDGAFQYCFALTSLTIGDNITSIGDNAFFNCEFLTSVNIGNSVTSIGVSAFDACFNLTSVTIGDSVTRIGDDAFNCCWSLTSVTIGNSVTRIGDSAFYDCTSLASVTIPNNVTRIGDSAFASCLSLTSVTFQGTINSSRFDIYAFDGLGDLRDKYLANGIGTYTRSSGGNVWTKQL